MAQINNFFPFPVTNEDRNKGYGALAERNIRTLINEDMIQKKKDSFNRVY